MPDDYKEIARLSIEHRSEPSSLWVRYGVIAILNAAIWLLAFYLGVRLVWVN